MSLEPYYFRPITPPDTYSSGAAGQHNGHSRNVSTSSYMTACDDSPESICDPTPCRAPVYRQHGPTLLPKIRTQDNNPLMLSAGQAQRTHKRALSSASNMSAYSHIGRPVPMRSSTEPLEGTSLMSPVSIESHSRASSVQPISRAHSRTVSTASVDECVLNRFGYPTYRQMPVFVTQPQHESNTAASMYSSSYMNYSNLLMDPPTINIEGSYDIPIDLECYSRPSSTSPPPQQLYPVATNSLLNYLTQPTQPVNLVRQLTFATGRGLSSHFWWDIRNVRPWASFSLQSMSTIPDLFTLLSFQHDTTSFPVAAASQTNTVTPASEADLANLINKIYFPKINTAARLSLGSNCPSFYLAPQPTTASSSVTMTNSQPTFLANYPTDSSSRTLTGLPRGRIVGLVKSFDRWNTGMRHEGPAQRVQYLKGLAHIQKCMRDHSCRYGFIITEIELVCVRAGCDESIHGNSVPWFGYVEVSDAIAVKTAAVPSSNSAESRGSDIHNTPFTVSLALYYLLMLAKSTPLPGQPGSFMDVGGPGALTRQKTWEGKDIPEEERGKDGKDKWIPEPQVGEKRDAKTARGWVWPADPWHKREGGGVGRKGRR